MLKKRHFLILLCLIFPAHTNGTTMEEALKGAAKYFTSTSIKFKESHKKFPKFKLILQSEAIGGITSKDAVFIKGSYEPRGKTIILRFQAVKGLFGGEILGQVNMAYSTKKARKKTLVAVLDIEAKTLRLEQRKILSDVFRTAFGDIGAFDMASSSEIDKMDADQIQVASGCTRDTCATIIGEQLGVDRVGFAL